MKLESKKWKLKVYNFIHTFSNERSLKRLKAYRGKCIKFLWKIRNGVHLYKNYVRRRTSFYKGKCTIQFVGSLDRQFHFTCVIVCICMHEIATAKARVLFRVALSEIKYRDRLI